MMMYSMDLPRSQYEICETCPSDIEIPTVPPARMFSKQMIGYLFELRVTEADYPALLELKNCVMEQLNGADRNAEIMRRIYSMFPVVVRVGGNVVTLSPMYLRLLRDRLVILLNTCVRRRQQRQQQKQRLQLRQQQRQEQLQQRQEQQRQLQRQQRQQRQLQQRQQQQQKKQRSRPALDRRPYPASAPRRAYLHNRQIIAASRMQQQQAMQSWSLYNIFSFIPTMLHMMRDWFYQSIDNAMDDDCFSSDDEMSD